MKLLTRTLKWLFGLAAFGIAAIVVRELGSTPPKDISSIRGANPLPPCPNTPTCTRESQLYPNQDPDVLFRKVLGAVNTMGATSIDADPQARTMAAEFRVVVFTDDLNIAITSEANGTALHVRSASRLCCNDLGVNRRRVRRLLHRIDAVPGA